MIDTLLLANIFSFIGKILFIMISFAETKKKMLSIQVLNAIFDGAACFTSGSYAGALSNLTIIIRNVLTNKNLINNFITGIICVVLFVLGIIVNNKGIFGFLPIIVSVIYTVIITNTENIKIIRIAQIVNRLLSLAHDIYFLLIPSIITGTIVIITHTYKLIKLYKQEKQESGQKEIEQEGTDREQKETKTENKNSLKIITQKLFQKGHSA